MADHQDQRDGSADTRHDPDESRRAALARLGRLAGYTAPAMLALLGATRARAQSAGSGDEGPPQ